MKVSEKFSCGPSLHFLHNFSGISLMQRSAQHDLMMGRWERNLLFLLKILDNQYSKKSQLKRISLKNNYWRKTIFELKNLLDRRD